MLLIQGKQLLTIDWYVSRSFDTQSDLTSIDIDYGNADVIPDVDLFAEFSAQNEHFATLLRALPTIGQGLNKCTLYSTSQKWLYA
jgi:hypothetical protein